MSGTLLAVLAGACYSAAYISPAPIWPLALFVSTLCVVLMRLR